MSMLSTARYTVLLWCNDIADRWIELREEVGRRVATSKRQEIRRLRTDITQIFAEVTKLRIAAAFPGESVRPTTDHPVLERDPHPGEQCSCGRPAVKVFIAPDGTAVPWCDDPAGCGQ